MRLRWKKIGFVAAAVLGPIVLGLAAAPHIVDVEAYKPGMIQAVRDATGRELVIDGPMKLSVLPVPGIGAGQVHFSNAVGAKGAQMLDVRWVAVTPSWGALLQGRIEVGTLKFYRPTIALETDANGKPNWEFAPGAGTKQTEGAASSGLHLAIGRIEIVEGTAKYTNPRTGKTFTADNVEGGATVRSFDGPFEIDGKATVNGVPLKLDVAVGAETPQGHAATLSLEVSSGKLAFKGTLSAVDPDARVLGHLTVKTGLLSDFVNSIVRATGAAKPDFDTSGAGAFTFNGDIVVSPERIAADNFDARMGNDDASGSLSLDLKPTPAIAGKLSLSRLDLGRWLEILSRPIDFAPEEVKQAAPATVAAAPSVLSKLDAAVTVYIAETHYHHDVIKDLSLILDMKKGAVALPRLKATLPGDMKIDADQSTHRFSLAGKDLRRTLKWLDVDTEGVPKGKLQTLEVDGSFASPAGRFEVSDGHFTLDGAAGTAGGTLLLETPLGAGLHAEMERFDLEAYRPKSADTPGATVASPASPAPTAAVAAKPASASSSDSVPKIGLELKVAHLPFRGETLNGVEGEAVVQGNTLRLKDVKVADAVGARLTLAGTVGDFGTAPEFDLAFTIDAGDADRLLDYAHLPHFINGKIGPVTGRGAVAGTSSAVTLRDVAMTFLGTGAQVSGSLAFSDPVAYDFSKFFLHTKDASALVSAATGRAMSSVGYIRATGSLKGTSENASFSGELRARGSRMNGRLDTTLDAHPRIVAAFKVPGVLKVDRWLGIDPKSAAHVAPVEDGPEPTATPATPQPIDLTALRSIDVKLSLQADTMTLASIEVEQADIDASLVGGVAKISRLAGQFYGGSASFAGTIDASGSALAVDMAGDVRGIAVDRLLRGTVGKNTLSASGFAVAIGGQIDATGMRITGKGMSSAEIRDALTGAATVAGHIAPVVSEGSVAFARFATSIGSIFSDGLAFDSQVLKSFIDRQSPIGGRFELSAGGLVLRDQTVQGANAIATLNGRTSFANDTTDTTVTLDSGGTRYITTIKGPVAAPTLNTTTSSVR